MNLQALSREVLQHLRHLYRMTILSPIAGDGDRCRQSAMFARGVPERMLRIEATPEIANEIMGVLCRYSSSQHPWDEPMTFQGVSIYRVHHALPECGWQIINPMLKVADLPHLDTRIPAQLSDTDTRAI